MIVGDKSFDKWAFSIYSYNLKLDTLEPIFKYDNNSQTCV